MSRMQKLLLVKNLETGKLDLVTPTLEVVHAGFNDIEDMKQKMQRAGHDVRTGSILNNPYLGRHRAVDYLD